MKILVLTTIMLGFVFGHFNLEGSQEEKTTCQGQREDSDRARRLLTKMDCATKTFDTGGACKEQYLNAYRAFAAALTTYLQEFGQCTADHKIVSKANIDNPIMLHQGLKTRLRKGVEAFEQQENISEEKKHTNLLKIALTGVQGAFQEKVSLAEIHNLLLCNQDWENENWDSKI